MDYTTLVASKSTAGSLASWINHATIQASAPTIVAEAEAWIYRRLRHWQMKKQTTGVMTVSTSIDYIALPSDYLADKILKIAGLVAATTQVFNTALKRKTDEFVQDCYQYDNTGARIQQMPRYFYTLGGATPSLKFDSPADLAYPYIFTYYAQPAALSGTLTNFLTTYYPRLMRCACMIGAAEFMKDIGQGSIDRTYWIGEAEKELFMAQSESDMEHRSDDGGAVIL